MKSKLDVSVGKSRRNSDLVKEANLRMFKDQLRVEYYRKLKQK